MKYTQNIGERIKDLRIVKGWSQAKLSERASIDSRNLSRIETGKASPKLKTIISISNALAITPNDILLYEFEENQPALRNELARLVNSLSDAELVKAIDYINYIQSQSDKEL